MSPAPLAQLARAVFTARQAKASQVVAARWMTAAQAEAHLRPWAAIATLCGADLPELAEMRADIAAQINAPCEAPGSRHDAAGGISGAGPIPPQADGMIRWLLAEEICPRRRWLPIFIAARDLACDRLALDGSEEAIAAAAALLRIGTALVSDVNGHPIPAYDAAQARARAAAREPERKAA